MTDLPNPFTDSGARAFPSDEAAACLPSLNPEHAAADIQSSDGRTDEAMARDVRGGEWESGERSITTEAASEAGVGSERSSPSEAIADLLEAIGGDCRFRLDVEAFMAAVELPLFLRTA